MTNTAGNVDIEHERDFGQSDVTMRVVAQRGFATNVLLSLEVLTKTSACTKCTTLHEKLQR